MPAPSWIESGDWDRLELGGVVMPGIARVEARIKGPLDKRKPKGGKKAVYVDIGAQPVELDIELELQDDELEEFEAEAVPLLRPPKAGAPAQKLAIGHPQARIWGVGVVKVGDVSSPMPSSGGTWIVKFKAWEHVDAPKKVKKPKEVAEGDWKKQANDAVSALKSPPSSEGPESNFSSPDQPLGSGFEEPFSQ